MNKQRWFISQEYEKNWWQKFEADLSPDYEIEYDEQLADKLTNDLADYLTISRETKILEIGSGAAGILSCLKTDFR